MKAIIECRFLLSHLRNNKTRSMAGFVKVHALGSPRDTALRSIAELKQFIGKNAITFLLSFSA
ncbi:hypothetical protein EXX26_21160 [Escherichia coli]|nr:hypothetical protein [Escherichia coli]RZY78003.1 hypothetical protein EXX26_21160 [Escherichia coli]